MSAAATRESRWGKPTPKPRKRTPGKRGCVMKSPQTVCYEIFREILREARQFGSDKYLVMASQVVIDLLLDEVATGLLNLQEFIGKPVHLQGDGLYNQEQFDVILIRR